MGFVLNILWDNFKLPIGYKQICSLVHYKKVYEEDEFPFVGEFKFCIDKFDLRGFDFNRGYRKEFDF